MAALGLLEDFTNNAMKRQRVFRDQPDFFTYGNEWLISRYRLPRAALLHLCAQIGPNIQRRTNCNQAIPVEVQVLSVLGFLATGTFQRQIGDRSGIPQPSVSRLKPAVLQGIIRLSTWYIKFPYTAEEQQHVMDDFVRQTGFPNVLGAVDCTHIAIRAPHAHEYLYVNRKHFHSINVQFICNARMAILNAAARWPGSTHGSFIVRNCSVGNRLEAGAGDRGYPLKPWLLTPIAHPQTAEEAYYNISHACSCGAHNWATKGKVAMSGCIGRETPIGSRQSVPNYFGLLCSAQYLHEYLPEEEMRMDVPEDPPPLPADWNAHAVAIMRRRQLIHRLFQQDGHR